MGNDGGTIPTRDELVRVKKDGPRKDKHEDMRIRWTSCALSKQLLKDPIVADRLGNLFNKEAIYEQKIYNTLPEEFSHIRSLKKDLLPVHFVVDDSGKRICPISQKEIGLEGSGKFSLIPGCGHVLSQRALSEIPCDNACLHCSAPFTEGELHVCATGFLLKHYQEITLNPNEEELRKMRARLEVLMTMTKEERKRKREKKKKSGEGKTIKRKESKKEIPEPGQAAGAIKAKLKKRRKLPEYEAEASKFEDSDVYKSLFVDKTKKGDDRRAEALFTQGSTRLGF